MRIAAAAVLVCCMAATLPATSAEAAKKREPPVTPGSTYLALGDSVSFGYQEPQVVPAPDYSKPAGFRGWPEHAARALHLKLVNASCPGETSASLIDASAPSNGCESAPGNPNLGYRKAYPLHVRYSGSQLAFAVSYLRKHPNTRLVSLMIGANDLFLCQETTRDGCASGLPATLKTVGANVRRIVSGIRGKARYRGQIVLMRYYAPDYRSAFLTGGSQLLNKTAYDAAKPYRVHVADGFGQWRAASAKSGDDPCTAGLLTQLGQPGTCGVHPSWAGQGLLALALARAVKR
jgi:lysophospholipase L1-like esterase